jgi:hypothetical protein
MKPSNKLHITRRAYVAPFAALMLTSLSAQTPIDATDGIEFGTGANDPAMGKGATTNDLDVGVANGNAFRVFSDGNTFPYFKAGEGNDAPVTAAKWYRIAKASGTLRANALFSLRDNISSGGHSTAVFRVGMSYGDHNRMGVTLLSHTSYIYTTFKEVRILEAGIYDNVYLEVKVNRKGDVRYSIQDNLSTGGWLPVDWTETTSIPAGYTERKFNIDKLFMVGDFQSRFSIARGGAIGFGAENGGVFPLEIAADGSLKSQGNTILDTNGLLSADSLQLGTAPAIDSTAASELFDFTRIVTPVDPTAQDSVTNVFSDYPTMADVAIDTSGNRYVTGSFYGTMTIGGTTLTGVAGWNSSAFVAKLDSNGSAIWTKVFKNGDDSSYGYGQGYSVSVSSTGEVAVAGYFSGSSFTIDNTHVLASAGSGDAFVVKLASSGAVTWAHSLGGTSYDSAQSVAIDGSGNVIVTGQFQSSNFATPGISNLSSAGGYDVFVTKLSGTDGTGVWAQRLGGTSSDYGVSLAVDTAGKVLVTGYFYSSQFTAGSITLQNTKTNSYDAFVVKLSDSTGTPEWARGMGGTSHDYARSVAVDSSGHVLVVGYFYSTNFSIGGSVPNLATAGTYDAFVAKLDGSTGNGLWSRSLGGTSSDYAYSVSVGANDTVLLGGRFYSPTLTTSGGTTLTNAGSQDIFVAEISSTNAVNWAKPLGGTGYESLKAAAVAPDGSITIVGSAGAGARLGSTPVGQTFLYSFDPAWLDTYQPESIASNSLGFYGSQATGDYSLALGYNGISDGKHAFTWGLGNFASGQSSTAWGSGNSASGYHTTAWGYGNNVSGGESTAWGYGNNVSGWESTAWGYGNTVSNWESTAWGDYNNVDGGAATAWGYGNIVSGDFATAWGGMNTAPSMAVTVMGMSNLGGAASSNSKWNWIEVDPLLEVANGGWSGNANALTTLKNGQTTLTNKHWKTAVDAGGDVTSDIVATSTQVPDENGSDIVDPNEYYSHGNALVVEGHTVMKGNVTLSKAQGDISMGAFGN